MGIDATTLGIITGIVTSLSGAVAVLFRMQSQAKDKELERAIARIAFLEARLNEEQIANTAAAEARTSFAVAYNDKIHESLRTVGTLAETLNKMGLSQAQTRT